MEAFLNSKFQIHRSGNSFELYNGSDFYFIEVDMSVKEIPQKCSTDRGDQEWNEEKTTVNEIKVFDEMGDPIEVTEEIEKLIIEKLQL